MSNTSVNHLNPNTPLAFLPPTLADQTEVSRYLLVATCGMYSWDVLLNLKNDWRLLWKYRFTLPTFVYYLSRFAAFAYIITSTTFMIGQVESCQGLQIALGWCFAVAVPATSFLFFLRVRAIFNENRFIVLVFTVTFLATLAGSITVPFAIGGGHIGPTKYCMNTSVKPFSSTGVIVTTVNDTLVFIAISWRLLQNSALEESWKARFKSFWGGQGLPAISRSLLQDGQQYYIITVGGNILTMAMILSPSSVPAVFHAMFTVPNVALSNSMACRVFRNVKFGRIGKTSTTTTMRSNSAPLPLTPHKSNRVRIWRSTITDLESQPGTEATAEADIVVTKSEVHEQSDSGIQKVVLMDGESSSAFA